MGSIARLIGVGVRHEAPAAAPPEPWTAASLELRFRIVPRVCGALVFALAALHLWGGRLEGRAGAALLADDGTVAASTALSFVLLGPALLVLSVARRPPALAVAAAVGGAVSLFGVLAGMGYLQGGSPWIEDLVRGAWRAEIPAASAMAPNTAVALALLGCALALFATVSSRVQRVAEWLACGAGLLALQALIGYGLGIQALYRVPQHPPMPLPTALGVLTLAVGILLLRPYQGVLRMIVDAGAAGVAARTLMPIALLVPLGLAVGVIGGVEEGLYSERVALALLVISITIFTLLAVGWTVGEVRTVDRERRRLLESEQLARREAEAALRAREELLAVVSHDLRNPLNTIHTSASLLLDGIPDRAEHPRYLAIIQRSSGVMNRLIQDLLDASRIEQGRLAMEPRRADLGPVLRETCEEMEQSAASEGVALFCDVPDDLPELWADPDRIRQAVTNLLGNALKFTPQGGSVRLGAEIVPEGVRLRVADTGCGIPVEDLPHLFEPFWQARGGERRGIGLGLAIVRGIVEAHGGRIEVSSGVGEGTAFSVTLPRSEPPKGRSPA